MTQMAPAATNNNKNFRNMKAAMQAAVPAHNASTIGLRMCGDRASTGISSQPTMRVRVPSETRRPTPLMTSPILLLLRMSLRLA